jgi:diguanylate cyclase (GGDEF)-like protein/PAS domain S-box-containing protein
MRCVITCVAGSFIEHLDVAIVSHELLQTRRACAHSINRMSATQKPECSSSPTSTAAFPVQLQLVAPQLASSIARQGVERELLSAANDALVSKTEELRQQRELFEVTLASIGDAVITADAQGNITYLNPVAETLTGWRSTDAAGLPAERVFWIMTEDEREPISNPIKLALTSGQIVKLPEHSVLIGKHGESTPVDDSTAPIRDAKGDVVGAVVVLRDVSAARSASLKISHQAQHDGLTDLPNRVLLNDRLTQAIAMAHRQQQQLAVLFLDLDRFKHINDSLGHDIGDRVLQTVSGRLLKCVRSSDTVSRQGGDEFVVLLAQIKNAQDAALCAEKIRASLSTPYLLDGHELYTTASIGIASFPEDGMSAELLTKHADLAMYRAKQDGGNMYCFFEANMQRHAHERQSLESGLHRAIDRREFVLQYQPRIDLMAGALVAVEVFLRWSHPQRGLLSPAQFMPIAEESGLIVPIGRWVLRTACRQLRAWRNAGLPTLRLAINVSAIELRAKEFLSNMRAITAEEGWEPGNLEIEINEALLVDDFEGVGAVLRALKDLGVQLALDDFGIANSSLAHLRRLPFDILKIDESFVRDLTTDTDNDSIVSAVISMSRNLNIRVVAEGVETRPQLEYLRQQRCGEAQGNYFCQPVGAEELTRMLEAMVLNRGADQLSRLERTLQY